MRPLPCALALLLTLSSGCASTTPVGSACAEAKPFCLAGSDCMVDRRGCEVCRCKADAFGTLHQPGPASARPENERDKTMPPKR
jgi:hypothetical protein